MTGPGIFLRRAILASAFFFFSALAALANCPQPAAVTQATLMEFTTIANAQRALRTALGETPQGLSDGRLGPRTRGSVFDLCELVAHPPGTDLTRATLDVMQEYLVLNTALTGWDGRPFDLDLMQTAPAEGVSAIGLALAAPPTTSARALRQDPTAYACKNISSDLANTPDAMLALETLDKIFGDLTKPQICGLISIAPDTRSVIDTYARLGLIERNREGALAILSNGAFLSWIDAQRTDRLRRLLATPSAIYALLDEYTAIPGSTPYSGSRCTPSEEERTGQYYVLTEDDIANIKTLISVNPVLQAFAQENPAYDSAGGLWRDLAPVLQAELGDCILPDIAPLATGPQNLPKAFQLAPQTAANLSALAPLAGSKDVLDDFQTRSFPSKPAFLDALRSALTASKSAEIKGQVVEIAETMAGAAEPMPPLLDTAQIDIAPEDRLPAPALQLRVTEAADQAVQSLIDNPGLTDTLAASTIDPAPVAGQIEGQVRESLAEEAAAQITAAVEQQITLVEPFVVPNFQITQQLSTAVTAVPFVRAAMSDSTGTDLPKRLASLAGVEFPSQRLFRRALSTVATQNGGQPFSKFVTERIVSAAAKTVNEPVIVRDYSQIARPDCDCTPELRREDLHAYGFYPFWYAPLPADRLPEGEEPAPLQQIDFGMLSDLAFYGLEFTYSAGVDGVGALQLNNTEQWQGARRDFINTAHRFRARADVSFDMRNWKLWSNDAIETAISLILEQIKPLDLRPINTPTLFDKRHPDGVTLIFPDYLGNNLSRKDMGQMVLIIKSLFESLPDRDAVRINLAFDFPLVGEPLDEPLFNELFQLLVKQDYVLRSDPKAPTNGAPPEVERVNAKIISNVLLFLERPTSDAKKSLRYRMEQGWYQGKNREAVLRSIIPVVPASGHRDIFQADAENPFRPFVEEEFSQFKDDVVYFEDNFAGVGFWPAPDITSADLGDLKRWTAAEFLPAPWPEPFTALEAPLTSICEGTICPNRAVILLTAIVAFVVMLAILGVSFYKGWAYKLGFTSFKIVGLVAVLNGGVLVTLFILWRCDPFSTAPMILFWLLSFLLIVSSGFNKYQNIKNDRKP